MKGIRGCFLVAVAALSVTQLIAQTPTGVIQGMISDHSGAVVPQGKVVITNVDTNESHELRSDNQGRYIQLFLMPGTYSVRVEMKGFRPFLQESIKLDIGQSRAVDVALELGGVTQEVTVVAAPPPVDVSTSSIGQVVENRLIMDLPLNGRDPFSLSRLAPGVVPNANPNASTPLMAGGRAGTSELQIDGVSNLGADNNPGVQDRLYVPQVNSVQEFVIVVNAMAAEYGRSGGGAINVASRSGTNTPHGSAFDFLQNGDLNANNFFANRTGQPRGVSNRNQWGGTLGGPVYVPHVYDGRNKSFFFVGFEGTNSHNHTLYTGTVPAAAWRTGNFSGLATAGGAPITIYDPLSGRQSPANPNQFVRDPFAGNVVPSARLDPVARNAMQYFPLPNATPQNRYTNLNDYVSAGPAIGDSNKLDTKFDRDWTSAWRMFVRVSQGWSTNHPFNAFGSIASTGVNTHSSPTSVAFDHTITLSPTVLINVRYGFGRYYEKDATFSQNFDLTSLGLPSTMNAIAQVYGNQFPTFGFNNVVTNLGPNGYSTMQNSTVNHSLVANFTKVLSRHTIKAGFEYRKFFVNYLNPGYPAGNFSFNSAWTQQEISATSPTAGYALASFLLGLPGSGQMSHDPLPATASSYYGVYLQDDFKLTRRLTLNIGLRYDVDTPRTERFNHMSYFALNEPSPLAGQVPANACAYCGDLMGVMHFTSSTHRQQTPTDLNNAGPRFGFAYNPGGGMSIRGAYGILYAPSPLQAAGPSGAMGLDGYRTTTAMTTTVDSMRTVYANLDNPFPNGYNLPIGNALSPLTLLGQSISESVFDAYMNPYVQEWNLNIQRKLPGSTVFEIAYLGNRGVHIIDGDVNINYSQLPASYMQYGARLNQSVANPFYGIITDKTSALSQPTVSWGTLQHPFPQYNGISSFRKPQADSIYHAMTMRADRRFSKGLIFLVSYTAGKLIDDSAQAVGFLGPIGGGGLDSYNLRLNRAVSPQDVAQRAVFTYVYELPVGRGKRFFSNAPRGLSTVVSGWQISGITTFQSGTPLVMASPVNNTGIGAGQRLNNNGQKARITGGTTDSRINEWFKTSVFSQPAAFTFGNTGRTIPDARNPGLNSTDLSIMKNSFLGPEGKLRLQYRMEMFGAFNTPQWGAPGVQLGTPNFGVITNASGARVIQMALKLIW